MDRKQILIVKEPEEPIYSVYLCNARGQVVHSRDFSFASCQKRLAKERAEVYANRLQVKNPGAFVETV